jgi:hypothetical protein
MTPPYPGTRFCIDCGLRVVALSRCNATGDAHGPDRRSVATSGKNATPPTTRKPGNAGD